MDLLTLIIVGVVVVAVIGLYAIYAGVIKNKNAVREALSGIDVQLKKRHDLVPNILTIAKKFMEHEKEIFEKVTELRTQAMKAPSGSKAKFAAEGMLDNLMGQLMVSVENYPQLKSDQTMVQAMKTYNEVEEHISAARRFYNSALTQLRNSVMIFPGSLFAGLAAEEMNYSYFEATEADRAAVNANQYL
ncbi:MAG TPA: LemA family protein [Candidatus Limenecus avicola]|mgnify:FL=1|uniref:LemA family protein n=1 Tax=Candidatus Limenecus avicola TaxID=2840847 RepID=A0A9D1MZE6_9CLOT|nr:lemA protein [Clostridium sp. CAG:306]DAB26458.1 MAG TPA: LemA family protein [Candidatus Gastranaerophilales bacterium HUM_21]HIU91987.1 LemA family protein [Candidatus Limenecus avicola]